MGLVIIRDDLYGTITLLKYISKYFVKNNLDIKLDCVAFIESMKETIKCIENDKNYKEEREYLIEKAERDKQSLIPRAQRRAI